MSLQLHPAQAEALVRRAKRGELPAFLRQGEACGWCRSPIRVRGHKVAVDAEGKRSVAFSSSALPDGVVLKACGNRRETRCAPCSQLYRGDARHLVRSGLEGGKGVDGSVSSHPAVLLTLTAPSFGLVHSHRGGGVCRPASPKARCRHGKPLCCFLRHSHDDEIVGTPLCESCYDYRSQVLHNAATPELWRRTSVYLVRHLARVLHLTQAEVRERYRVCFARVAEFQRRGAVHIHVVVRLDRADGTKPDVGANALARACLSAAHAVFVSDAFGTRRWGHEVDVQVLDRSEPTRARRVGAYVAKYAVKSSHHSGLLDRRLRSEGDISQRKLPSHARRLVRCAWELGSEPLFSHLHLRRYAHSYGYGGHFLSKSRCYSTTLGALRAARAEWRRSQSPGAQSDAVSYESHWLAVGIGWANRGEALHARWSRP
jgi:hypothetical protein